MPLHLSPAALGSDPSTRSAVILDSLLRDQGHRVSVVELVDDEVDDIDVEGAKDQIHSGFFVLGHRESTPSPTE